MKKQIFTLMMLVPSVLSVQAEPTDQVLPHKSEARTIQISLPSDGESSDALFRRYVDQRFNEKLPGYQPQAKGVTRSGYESLTGYEAKLYDALVPRVQAVASGALRNTVFEIPVATVYPGCGPYTAAQLGLSDFNNSQVVENRIKELFEIDITATLFALLDDMPLELFWFDKTMGYYESWPAYEINDGKLSLTGTMGARMTVAQDYSSSNAEGTYNVRTDLSKVTTAITTAQNIVTQVAAMASQYSLTTADILQLYMMQVCNLTEYDFDAPGIKPYGDPWQLIDVFDGDPNTMVVCEGYAKAFKYLCDLSGFEDIECLTVSGDLGYSDDDPSTPPGAHMWNIVRMDDGRNYLFDPTNADAHYENYLYTGFVMAYVGDGGTASGSYADGYHVLPLLGGSWYCTFEYDDYCKSTFGEQALTLSTVPYEAPQASDKKLTLSDAMDASDVAAQLNSVKGQSDVHVNLKRTNAVAGQPITVCLPFSFPIPTAIPVGTFYTFGGVTVDDTDGSWVATMNEFTGSALAANTPYILIPTYSVVDFSGDYAIPATVSAGQTTVGRWTFKGNYAPKTWSAEANDYGFMATAGAVTDGTYLDAGTFVKVTNGASCAPMRCYLSYTPVNGTRADKMGLPDRIKVVFVNSKGDTTGIGSMDGCTGEVKADVWYDLQGRRLSGKPEMKGLYIHNGAKELVK